MASPVRWSFTVLSIFLISLAHGSFSQLLKLDSIKLDKNIITFSADRSGNIFLSTEGGTIIKYNQDLDSLLSFNPVQVGDFKLLEAWHGFQVFAFNQKYQDFVLLDRFLSRENRYSLGNSGLFFVDLATISSDQNLWLLEDNSLRLMKYDFRSNKIVLSLALDTWLESNDHNFTFLREYQNLLFLVDKESGTYVFDNLGNFLKKLNTGNTEYLSFSGETLYYLSKGKLQAENLYSNEITSYNLTASDYKGLLVVNQMAYLISEQKIERYSISKN